MNSDNILKIHNLPSINSSLSEINDLYIKFEKEVSNSMYSSIEFNLIAVGKENIHALSFLDCCLRFCKSKALPTSVVNINSELKMFLENANYDFYDNGEVIPILPAKSRQGFFQMIGEQTLEIINDSEKYLKFVTDTTCTFVKTLLSPSTIKWKEAAYYIEKAGSNAVPIVVLLSFLMGAILAFQGVIQMGRFGLSIFVANLVGLSIVKELGAIMVAMICIGRAGSAFASEIATMKVNEEIDAMKTLGLDVGVYLVIPKMIALIIVMPLLTVLSNVAGIVGGMIVSTLQSNISLSEYYFRTVQSISAANMMEGVCKSVVYAILIAGISCFRGLEAENDAKGVGKAATSAVVSSLFLIVVADAIITTVFR